MDFKMEKKTPGRPKLYETSNEKIDAFRKRQQSAGYIRKEILVTKDTWDQISTLADGYGIGTADVASGLLEYGLESALKTEVVASGSLAANSGTSAQGSLVKKGGMNPLGGVVKKGYASTQSLQSLSRSAFTANACASNNHLRSVGLEVINPTDDNPITSFFNKRKGSPNDSK